MSPDVIVGNKKVLCLHALQNNVTGEDGNPCKTECGQERLGRNHCVVMDELPPRRDRTAIEDWLES